jgi:probable HAF family extracellular repeat protein
MVTSDSGVNDRAQVVGGYTDTDGTVHGYLWDRGRFTTLDVPGAVTTVAFDINNRVQVVGQYQDTGGRVHGFLWERGRFTIIDAPLTTTQGINDLGQIVGYSATDLDLTGARGFLLAKACGARSPRSVSPVHPGPWPTASTTEARSSASSASTRTPAARGSAAGWRSRLGGPPALAPSRRAHRVTRVAARRRR